MTTEKIKKYIQERNYHLTENDIKELFKSPPGSKERKSTRWKNGKNNN